MRSLLHLFKRSLEAPRQLRYTAQMTRSLTDKLLRVGLVALMAFAGHPAQADKSLTLGINLLAPTLGNPHQNVSLPGTLPLQAIFDTLTRIGADGSAGPALATTWEMEDQNTWVLTLRRDVMFSNGEPFDANAVIAAFDYLLSFDGTSETIGTHLSRVGVIAAEARDNYTVAITTAKPNAILPIHLDFVRIPAPKHFADLGPKAFALDPIGTGPFTVKNWQSGRINLTANPTAWRPPALDEITLVQLEDPAARVQGLLSGSLDVAFNVAAEDKAAIEAAGGRIATYANPSIAYLQFVTAKESPLTDVRVRRALNHAVNRDLLLSVMYDDAVDPASQVAHPLAFGFNPALTPHSYDPERARALLAEAGYAEGFDMVMVAASADASDDQAHQQIAADLARIGVNMEIRRTTFGKYLEYMYQTGWPDPIVAFSMVTSGFDPMHGFRTRSCKWTPTYYCDEAIMPLIEAAESAADPEQRRKLVGDVLAYERDNPPGLFKWQSPAFDALAARVTRYEVEADALSFHTLDVAD